MDNSHKYRLIIITPNSKSYYSDYVPVLDSPPIDSVFFKLNGNNVVINSATHDATNTVQFYRWDFNETWIIHSAFFSYFKSDGTKITFRNLIDDNVYQCWSSDTSNSIVINSTSKLKQAVITNNIITTVDKNSPKVVHKYSILVNQYALTGDAYKFWTNLKSNTEQLGSIFDAQPSQINGNIHCLTNPAEPVIGYISAGTVASKRIFINHEQLPLIATNFSTANCELDSLWYIKPITREHQVDELILYKKSNIGIIFIPITPFKSPNGTILGYMSTTPFCADCTLRGTNRKPDFWK